MSNQIVVSVGRLVGGRFVDAEGVVQYNAHRGSGKPLYIRAEAHAVYRLADEDTGLVPENIELVQVGNHLHIRAKDSAAAQPDIVIEDYYVYAKPENGSRVFAFDAKGNTHYYEVEAPETALLAQEVTVGRSSSGGVNKLAVALGGLAGAGLIGALAGGGGGGKSSHEAAAPSAPAKVNRKEEAPLGKMPSEEKNSGGAQLFIVTNDAEPTVADVAPPADKQEENKEIEQERPSEKVAQADTVEVSEEAAEVAPAEDAPSVADQEKTKEVEQEEPSEKVVQADTVEVSEEAAEVAPAEDAPSVIEQHTAENQESEKTAEVENAAVVKPVDQAEPTSPDSLEKVGNNDSEVMEVRFGKDGHFYIYQHEKYGRYIDAAEFGTDATGKTDSLAAINNALAAAHQEKVAVRLSGKLYISDQIVLNKANSGVTGIFGDGMGKTVVSFDKAQKGVFNPNSNEDDVRDFAGILVDGQSNKTIADLSVKYTHPDFYRKGQSYFGKVNGILVNDADNTLISKVEVSGANRAGVFFTSTQALQKDPESAKGRTYKARLIWKEVDEHYDNLPLGENNRIVDSYLHHNRVAGALVAYQKDFVASGNKLAWNGHEADGGTGYGIASMAGSYNYGITYTNNTTDHNYRKGLDVHDGDDVVIANNTLIGDRLYGISVYNRQFTMDTVKIADNTIIQDPTFRLAVSDNPRYTYHGYSGIQVQTNTQFKDLNSSATGKFEIHGNTIKNLEMYKNAQHTYGIEFRNHEQKMHYQLDISNNVIQGESTKYMIAVINNTRDRVTGDKGSGAGDINITGNKMSIGVIPSGTVPVFINEESNNGKLRGKVTFEGNDLTIRKQSDGSIEGIQMIGNAQSYHVNNNNFEIHGNMNKPLISVLGRAGSETPDLHAYGNDITTDLKGQLYRSWIERSKVDVFADDNTHNNKALAKIEHITAPAAGAVHDDGNTANLWDIGTDSISGIPVDRQTSSAQSERSESVVLKTGEQNEIFLAEPQDTAKLDNLLAVTELNLSGLLGKENTAAFAENVIVPEYSVLNVQAGQWQDESAAAYVV